MNVENRKLFRNKDARSRLANMGGIIASSPELLGTVQKFQEGGEVKPTPVSIGNALFYIDMQTGTVFDDQGAVISDPSVINVVSIKATQMAQAPSTEGVQQIKTLDTSGSSALDELRATQANIATTEGIGSLPVSSVEQPFMFSDTTGVSRDGRTNEEILAQARSLMPQPNRDSSGNLLPVAEPVSAPSFQSLPMNVAADSGPESGMFSDDVKGGFNIMPPAPYLSEAEQLLAPPSQPLPMNVAADSGPESGMFSDDVKGGFNIMPPAPYRSGLDEFFSETIENQKQAMPGGVNISEYRENLENYLSPESMQMAETIQVGNVPYKYDRNTGTAYRMDGAPIAAAEQASVDRILTSDQPVGFGTFSTDSPTPIEMLNAPIEASQQAQDAKVTAQEDLVYNMDPKKTTFAERAAERKRLMELNELPSVTADDVGAPEPLITQEEVADLSEDRRTGASAQEQNQKDADAIPQKNVVLQLSNVENTTVKPGDPEATTKSFIDAALGEPSDDPKKNIKSYEAQFREMLGIKDKDKAKEMWHNLSMIGFAIAAGRDPSALANIAQGMLEGTKMMKADRDADEKLNQDIALMAFAERNKDNRLDAQLASQEKIAGMRKTQGVLKNRAGAVQDMLTTMSKSLKYLNMPIEEQVVIANNLINAMPEYGGTGETSTSAASASAGPAIGQRENDAVEGLIEYTKDGWRKVATG